MEITNRAYADVVVVTPTGRIDHATAEALERAVVPLLDPAAGSVPASCSISPVWAMSAASGCAC